MLSISAPLFPAAHTKSIFEACITSFNAVFSSLLPQLQFTILAPMFSAYWIALIISLVYALPLLNTFNGITFADGATPAIPLPLSFTAAMIPAICVPWFSSVIFSISKTTLLSSLKFQPFVSSIFPFPSSSMPLPEISSVFTQIFSAKSSCAMSTPVSITATVIPLPVEILHASVTPASHK